MKLKNSRKHLLFVLILIALLLVYYFNESILLSSPAYSNEQLAPFVDSVFKASIFGEFSDNTNFDAMVLNRYEVISTSDNSRSSSESYLIKVSESNCESYLERGSKEIKSEYVAKSSLSACTTGEGCLRLGGICIWEVSLSNKANAIYYYNLGKELEDQINLLNIPNKNDLSLGCYAIVYFNVEATCVRTAQKEENTCSTAILA